MTETAASGDATDAKTVGNIVVKEANDAAIIGKTEETTVGEAGDGLTMPMIDGNAAIGTETAKTDITVTIKTATIATAGVQDTKTVHRGIVASR